MQVTTVAVLAMLAMWFRGAVARELNGYVSTTEWMRRNVVVDDRLERIERSVMESRAERIAFQTEMARNQREMIERLTRIEERLTLHMGSIQKALTP